MQGLKAILEGHDVIYIDQCKSYSIPNATGQEIHYIFMRKTENHILKKT